MWFSKRPVLAFSAGSLQVSDLYGHPRAPVLQLMSQKALSRFETEVCEIAPCSDKQPHVNASFPAKQDAHPNASNRPAFVYLPPWYSQDHMHRRRRS
ncbi:hypothetical protein BD310DRAFT_88855 [Dichomitus squalens]|uniref:Uncharacterized protein n=1 Tax=Dichomitus squalens TaxID=114155 RepID=A0A4Q9Q596_9APHY|nr:hypothetical protein BD310DRAFT_88855 [Dichomitus squalens]